MLTMMLITIKVLRKKNPTVFFFNQSNQRYYK